jgi:hypothetical protein
MSASIMFHHVPKDILRKIARKLSLRDRINVALTCRLFNESAQKDLTLEKLFFYAKHAQLKPAVAMIAANPDLLLETLTCWDASGVRLHVDRTIYQFLLGAEDPEFCLALTPFFACLGVKGEFIRLKQIKEQFPEPLTTVANTDFINQLAALVAAFTAASHPEVTAALIAHKHDCPMNPLLLAIQQFRTYLRQPVEMTTGRHFNMAMFHAVLKAYATNFHQWEIEHCRLFSIKVIGDMVKLLPRRYQLACLQGLKYVVEDNKELARPFLRDDSAGVLCPADTQPGDVLGEDFYIDKYLGVLQRDKPHVGRGMSARATGDKQLNGYVLRTRFDLQRLRAPVSNQILADDKTINVSHESL